MVTSNTIFTSKEVFSFLTAYPDTTASINSLAAWVQGKVKSCGLKSVLTHFSTTNVRKILSLIIMLDFMKQ